MSTFLHLTADGIIIGVIYVLAALGMTVIFGVMRIASLAHGAFYMLGAYFVFWFCMQLALPYYIAVMLGVIMTFVLGMAVERFILRKIKANELSVVIATLALAFVLEEGIKFIWGPFYRNIPPVFPGTISYQGFILDKQRFLAFLIAIGFVLIFLFILKWTKIGMAIRMVAQDEEAAQLLGININVISMLTFGVGAALAASAAALLSPVYLIYPSMGWTALLRSLAIVILGGMGSVAGTIVAGLLFGIIEVYTAFYISPELATIDIFLVLILVIVFRPAGIFGVKIRS